MKYDIFISYRRSESSGRSNVPMARTFKLEFERRGYKVFFDYSECTDNYFSDIILPAIRACDFFVLVLTKDCLLRCSNEGDWVRREIEEAITFNRKIIPITPDKECESFPLGLPDLLKRTFDGLQITTVYTDHMFEASVDYLVKNRFYLNNVQTDSKTERKAKEANGHEWVDLGLPSGTLWATCNVGANKPEEFGNYYAWGETSTKSAYDWITYKYAKGASDKLTKYCGNPDYGNNGFIDNLTILQGCNDPAMVNWGNGWYIPSKAQWDELLSNTINNYQYTNGIAGRLFTSRENGQYLFLPEAGYRYGNKLYNGSGCYWSSLLIADYPYVAWYFGFKWGYDYSMRNQHRYYGHSVRPVREK